MIDFRTVAEAMPMSWDSVTRPLDRLPLTNIEVAGALGFSHQTP